MVGEGSEVPRLFFFFLVVLLLLSSSFFFCLEVLSSSLPNSSFLLWLTLFSRGTFFFLLPFLLPFPSAAASSSQSLPALPRALAELGVCWAV